MILAFSTSALSEPSCLRKVRLDCDRRARFNIKAYDLSHHRWQHYPGLIGNLVAQLEGSGASRVEGQRSGLFIF